MSGIKIAADSLITLPAQFQIWRPGLFISARAEIRHVIGPLVRTVTLLFSLFCDAIVSDVVNSYVHRQDVNIYVFVNTENKLKLNDKYNASLNIHFYSRAKLLNDDWLRQGGFFS